MATLFKASGGTIGTLVPTTSWAAPNGLFPTTDRNDSSAYTWTSSTSTVTLPSSGLADGYLIVAAFETEDSSNGRYNPQGRIVQASGTGTFVGASTGGYSRDNSEDRAYVRCWGFVDNPSASATFQFQWQRDADAPNTTDGTVRSEFQVIPFYYADIGLYSSTSTTATGGTTPTQITGFTGTDGTNITLTSNVVSVTGDNKRYLILGSSYHDSLGGGTRTQRWAGLEIDGTFTDAAKGYTYYRNASNDESGEMFTWLIETVTATRTIELNQYRGNGVANLDGGADVDGATTSTAGVHSLVVIELNDSAEVFRSRDATQSALLATTGPVDLDVNDTTDFNDTASFTSVVASSVNCVQTADYLFGANISVASNSVGDTTRWTAYSEFTVNGTEDSDSVAGDYMRNNQGSQDTFGWSANLLGFQALTAGDDVGVSVTELAGSEGGGAGVSPAGWTGFWGINLDTLSATGTTINATTADIAAQTYSATVTYTNRIEVALSGNIAPGATTAQLTAPSGKTTADFDAGRIEEAANPATAIDITLDDYTEIEWNLRMSSEDVGATYQLRVTSNGTPLDTYTVTPTLTVTAAGTTINASLASIAAQTYQATVQADVDTNISGTTAIIAAETYQATVQADVDVTIDATTAQVASETYQATVQADVDTNISATTAIVAAETYQATVQADVDTNISASLAEVAAQTFQATVQADVDTTISGTTAIVAAETYQASITLGVTINASTAIIAAQTFATTNSLTINANVAQVAAETFQALVGVSTTISATIAEIASETYQATVQADVDTNISAGTALVAAQTYQATVQADVDTTISATTADIAAQTYQATVGQGQIISANTAIIAAQTYGATVQADVDTTISANTAQVAAATYQATVQADVDTIISANVFTAAVETYQATINTGQVISAALAEIAVQTFVANLTVPTAEEEAVTEEDEGSAGGLYERTRQLEAILAREDAELMEFVKKFTEYVL